MFDNVLDGQKYRKERYKEFYFGGATLDFSKRVKPWLNHDFKLKLERFFVNDVITNKRGKDRCLTMFSTAKKLKRAFIRTFIFGVPYWICPKGSTHDFESKLESLLLILFCQNRISKDAWRCFRRWSWPKRAFIARIFLRVVILDFSKGVSPWFWVKIGKFPCDCLCSE